MQKEYKNGEKIFTDEQNEFLKLSSGIYENRKDIVNLFNEKFNTNFKESQIRDAMHRNNSFLKSFENIMLDFIKDNSECMFISSHLGGSKNERYVTLKCPCGDEFTITYRKFKTKKEKVCRKCSNIIHANNRKLNPTDVYNRINEIHNNKIIPQEDFTLSRNYANFKCSECNNIWNATWNSILVGHGCKKCDNVKNGYRQRYDYDKILELLPSINPNIILKTTENINSHVNLEWECKRCGELFYKNWNNVREGQDCIHCSGNKSKGEIAISEYLFSKNIKFRSQHSYDDCLSLNGYKLRYDFIIEDYGCLIEYDGEQHFMPVSFSGDDDSAIINFEKTKLHDSIKNEYCKNNNITLIRIPYWKFNNIETILDNIFYKDIS